MSNSEDGRLYNLLPAIYRIRDLKEGGQLRALLGVIEDEMRALEEDIDGLYEDWFIETCADWVIPYIGDGLGVHGVHPLSARAGNIRAYVANTLAYRRRKGTAAVLEQVCRDVTGWPAHAVEFFQHLAVTQNLNHLRMKKAQTANVRDADQIDLLNGPFDTAAHNADIRRISSRRGKYNIPNVGLFLWRLQSYPLDRVTARKEDEFDGSYRFDPTGRDMPLFNRPQTEIKITHLSEEINVPGRLRPIPLYEDLETYRRALINCELPRSQYFGKNPVFSIHIKFADGVMEIVKPEEIVISDLLSWNRPPSTIEYYSLGGEVLSLPIRAAVDPKRGRLALAEGISPEEVVVSYSCGFSGDVGAGPYDRYDHIKKVLKREVDWQAGVSQEKTAVHDESIFGTIGEAVAEWNDQPAGTFGLILIMDSRSYKEDLKISIPEGSRLSIVAADWPAIENPGPSPPFIRLKGQLTARGQRPHIIGAINVIGIADIDADPGGLLIDGLLIEGKLMVAEGNLGELQLAHSTLVPADGGVFVLSTDSDEKGRNSSLKLVVCRTICGKLDLSEAVPELSIEGSIIDPDGIADRNETVALTAKGAKVRIEDSTIIGKSEMRSLEATNSIFTGMVTAEEGQKGCVRYTSLPYNSHTPRRFRCQPDSIIAELASRLETQSGRGWEAVQIRLHPVFTSLDFGDPGYAQLGINCAEEISSGSEDGSEMGVFGHLQQPQREANLCAALEEYLRFGLESGIFYVT